MSKSFLSFTLLTLFTSPERALSIQAVQCCIQGARRDATPGVIGDLGSDANAVCSLAEMKNRQQYDLLELSKIVCAGHNNFIVE